MLLGMCLIIFSITKKIISIYFFKDIIYKMNKYVVEFLGTMFLVFVIFATGNYLAIGAALAVAVLLGGAISGGAFNPAVAIALMYAGKLPRADLIPYIVAQVAGALAGFEAFKMLMKKQ
jgi:aquaporin Z